MSAYCQEFRKLEGTFNRLELTHVLHNDNNEANEFVKMGSRWALVLTGVFVQQLHQPTISEKTEELAEEPSEAEVFMINPEWTTPYLNYLLNDELPEDQAKAKCIMWRSWRYVVVGGKELYRRSAFGVLLWCISKEDRRKLLKEIYLGIYGNHAVLKTLGGNAYRQCFF